MKKPRRASPVAYLLLLTLSVACATGKAYGPNSKGKTRGGSTLSVAGVLSPPALAYMRPAGTKIDDGMLYVRAAPGAPDVSAGAFTEVTPIPGASALSVRAFSISGTGTGIDLSRLGTALTPPLPYSPDGSMWWGQDGHIDVASGGVVYAELGDKSVEVGRLDDSALAGSGETPTFDSKPRKGLSSPMIIRTGVATSEGIIVGVSDTVDSKIVNLARGTVLDLGGYGMVQNLVQAQDGKLYALAWDYSHSAATIHLLEFAPTDLKRTGDWDTGITPNGRDGNELLRGRILSGSSGITTAIARRTAGGVTELAILTLTSEGLKSIARLTDVGFEASVAGADSVYVFGGPGENRVGLLDLSTAVMQADVEELRAPAGTYVVAVGSL